MRTAIWATAATVAICGLVGVTVWKVYPGAPDNAFAECGGGASSAAIGGPFELVNAAGETVTDADVITEPSLIYFGYTFCPDVCPLDMVRNAEAVDILAEQGYSVKPVFITVDPARDTPEVVGDFADTISERIVGLTGSPEQVDAASKAYRTYYKAHTEDDPEYYLVDHSTFTYLTLPETGFAGFFRRELSGEQLADQVQCFLDAG
ncbi:SCO family protein [Oceanicola sp. 502str15]|uniref:SCO family protein n=1 Tax=Oceanicola sp. 502str15 TaxID=2696061 RepID=UPI00209629C2|nr:SCO family protein [Oceanicola sp. 502str15]MCO6384167.1 SCO family protein [Oceanicola sp. 502str15]